MMHSDNNNGNTVFYRRLLEMLRRKGALHATIFDPDPQRQSPSEAGAVAAAAERCGSDLFLVGGSTCFDPLALDATVEAVKDCTGKPVIIFPGAVQGSSSRADAIMFLSVLNSSNHQFLIGQQVLGAMAVRQAKLEAIGTAYLIVEPGGTAGWISEARLLPRNKPELAAAYALAAQYMGFKLIYLEAGSGEDSPVPARLIAAVSGTVDIPIMVGGGIAGPRQAAAAVAAGADVIVQGSFVERSADGGEGLQAVTDAVHSAADGRNKDKGRP